MNIKYLHELLSRVEEIKVIGKNVNVDGVTCHVMGIVRFGMQMQLLILQYDENFQEQIEEREGADLCETPNIPESNRMRMCNNVKVDVINPFQSVCKVFIGEREFEVYSSEYRRLNTQDLEYVLMISKFLNNGWKPNGIDHQNINKLFLTSLELNGDYTSIPAFDEDAVVLRFAMRPQSMSYLVEQTITLVVGGKYPDKLMFRDAVTGAEHWAQINRVYLSDMWEEMDKTFTNPRLQEQMTSEEIAQARLDFEKHFLEICPRGMCFPVVEYECEDDIFLQFYSKYYLDAKPVHKSSSIGFRVRPDQTTGILGLKLKANIIQEPVPANTIEIQAELFHYNHTTTREDILLE